MKESGNSGVFAWLGVGGQVKSHVREAYWSGSYVHPHGDQLVGCARFHLRRCPLHLQLHLVGGVDPGRRVGYPGRGRTCGIQCVAG